MAVGEEDGLRGKGVLLKERDQGIDVRGMRHAGVDYGAKQTAVGPAYYTIGPQRIELKDSCA